MPPRLSLPCLALLLGLVACGGGALEGDALAPAPSGPGAPLPVRPVVTDVVSLAMQYVDVVQTDPRFDECLGPGHRCLRGPRTGSGLDLAVHEWMRLNWSAIPEWQAVQEQTFSFPRYRVSAFGLTVDGRDVPAFPWYGQGYTPAGGIRAPLASRGDLAGRIVLLRFRRPFNADAADPFTELRAAEAAGAVGAVVTFDTPDNLLNAHNYVATEPLGRLPTLIVGPQDFNALRHGQTVDLRLEGAVEPGVARNSLAYLPGASERLLVIGTPMNTWLVGGGERAPGAAILIDLARHLAGRTRREGPLPYSVLLLATGAHEVFGFGLERALTCLPPDRIHAYVHLGAGLVSRAALNLLGNSLTAPGLSQTRSLSTSENPVLREVVNAAFGNPRLQPFFRFDAGRANPGEAFVAYNLGLPMMSFSGTNPFHHTPEDDARQMMTEALPWMAEAYREVVDGLLATDYAALRAANATAESRRGPNPGYPCAGPITGLNP